MVGWAAVGSMMEGGGLVGRRAVCRSFPKKNFNSGVGPKKCGIKNCPPKKKLSYGIEIGRKKKGTRRKK
jgi:hypothetical protein